MKLLHLSDLHLGKKLNEFSLIEDQKNILDQILDITKEEKPQAVLIAGDIYDRGQPPAEAVELLDDFLNRLVELGTTVLMISGNHDSAVRLSFGSQLFNKSGVHISPVYDGNAAVQVLNDSFGEIKIYLLPFVRPADVRAAFPDEKIDSYNDAVWVAVEKMNVDTAKRNIIVTHQFITGGLLSESEEFSVGGTDQVDAAVFDSFDYVALGHLHNTQSITRPTVRYCGTPLKYSLAECSHHKSVTVVELGAKGDDVQIRTVPLIPKRDVRVLRGTYNDLMSKQNYENTNRDDYVGITLTDEDDVYDALTRLRQIYPNILSLTYDNTRTQTQQVIKGSDRLKKSPLEIFSEFFELLNNKPMSPEQQEIVENILNDMAQEEIQ